MEKAAAEVIHRLLSDGQTASQTSCADTHLALLLGQVLLDPELHGLIQTQTSTEQEGTAELPAPASPQGGEHFGPDRGPAGTVRPPEPEGDHIPRWV